MCAVVTHYWFAIIRKWKICYKAKKKKFNKNSTSLTKISLMKPLVVFIYLRCGWEGKASFWLWSWSHGQVLTRTVVTLLRPWIRRFTMITVSLLGCFKLGANSVGKNSKKSTGTLNHWKLLSRCGFLQARNSDCNEKCTDHLIFSVWCCWVTGG